MPKFPEKIVDVIKFSHNFLEILLALVISSLVSLVQIIADLSDCFGLMVDSLGFLIESFNKFISSREYLFQNLFPVALIDLLVVFAGNLTEVHLLIEFSDLVHNGVKSLSLALDRLNSLLEVVKLYPVFFNKLGDLNLRKHRHYFLLILVNNRNVGHKTVVLLDDLLVDSISHAMFLLIHYVINEIPSI